MTQHRSGSENTLEEKIISLFPKNGADFYHHTTHNVNYLVLANPALHEAAESVLSKYITNGSILHRGNYGRGFHLPITIDEELKSKLQDEQEMMALRDAIHKKYRELEHQRMENMLKNMRNAKREFLQDLTGNLGLNIYSHQIEKSKSGNLTVDELFEASKSLTEVQHEVSTMIAFRKKQTQTLAAIGELREKISANNNFNEEVKEHADSLLNDVTDEVNNFEVFKETINKNPESYKEKLIDVETTIQSEAAGDKKYVFIIPAHKDADHPKHKTFVLSYAGNYDDILDSAKHWAKIEGREFDPSMIVELHMNNEEYEEKFLKGQGTYKYKDLIDTFKQQNDKLGELKQNKASPDQHSVEREPSDSTPKRRR